MNATLGRCCPSLCAALSLALLLPGIANAQVGDDVTAASTVYLRTDTNRTTVVTPRLRVAQEIVDGTRVDLSYVIDVWSSASVDIVSAATPRVSEQRDEINVGITQELGSTTSINANYRYSTENDYTSHGGTLGVSFDVAQRNTTLGLSVTALKDDVGRAGQPSFHRTTDTLAMRASISQLLSRDAIVQVIYEYGALSGYLSSPYRYVGFGDAAGEFTGTCKLPSRSCRLELNPDARTRNALAVRGRHALGDSFSAGLGYRFYIDDWDLTSHTADVDLGWNASDAWLLSVDYRVYRQSAASHYQAYYLQDDNPKLYTSDKELSPMTSHRGGVRAVRTWTLDDGGRALRSVLSLGLTYFQYDDFLRVRAISAFESTLGLEYVL